MTLGDVLQEYDNRDFTIIEYRVIISIDSDDVDGIAGFCSYLNNELITLDNDTYSLDDEIVKHELYKDDWLVVWYEEGYEDNERKE